MSHSTAPPGSAVAGDRGAGEEPSADQEPSANEEPSADEEPSAHEEPSETEHRLADLPAEPETPAVDADAALAQEESPDAAPAVPVSRLNASVRMPVREATSADRSMATDPFSSQLFAQECTPFTALYEHINPETRPFSTHAWKTGMSADSRRSGDSMLLRALGVRVGCAHRSR